MCFENNILKIGNVFFFLWIIYLLINHWPVLHTVGEEGPESDDEEEEEDNDVSSPLILFDTDKIMYFLIVYHKFMYIIIQ